MIDGVVILNLKTHSDDRGFFREIVRFEKEFPGIKVGQLSHSLVNKDVIKGWHGHKVQAQWNYVVNGKIKVVLIDNRKNSSTFREKMEFVVGDGEESKTYFFPPGVLHGYKCLTGPMNIIYVTTGVYDLTEEIRINENSSEIGYDWGDNPK